MSAVQILTWVILVTLALWMLAAYNRLVRGRN